MIKSFFRALLRHKFRSLLILALLAGGGYYAYQKTHQQKGEIRYILGKAEKGTLTVSVSGSGQISTLNRLDIKAKVGGDVSLIGAKNGEELKAGALLVRLDDRDAQKTVRDAQTNLESARLALLKLQKPADALALLQSENALAQAKETKQKNTDTLAKSYEDGFNTVSNAFLNLPAIVTGLHDMFFDNTISVQQDNIDWYADQVVKWDSRVTRYKTDVASSYATAREKYDKNFLTYKSANRNSDSATTEKLIFETYETAKLAADTIKTSDNYLDFVQDLMDQYDAPVPSLVGTHQTTLQSYTGTVNTHLLNLLAIKNTIEDSKTALINADRSIAEKTEQLSKLKAGTDELDIQSQELAVKQRENALRDAQEKLADYSMRMPFDGVVATLDAKKGDSISASSVLGSLITKQKIAEISLNEVDVTKVRAGQRATLTFDAIPELRIGGEVTEIDTVGTVSQGVVTYTVQIAFDAQENQVKPGMSATASIVIDSREDVLMAPASAVKTQNRRSFVEVVTDTDRLPVNGRIPGGITLPLPPKRQPVETGISNDEFIEILQGINEGDILITRTIEPTGTPPAQTQNSAFPGFGNTRTGGGNFRR